MTEEIRNVFAEDPSQVQAAGQDGAREQLLLGEPPGGVQAQDAQQVCSLGEEEVLLIQFIFWKLCGEEAVWEEEVVDAWHLYLWSFPLSCQPVYQ